MRHPRLRIWLSIAFLVPLLAACGGDKKEKKAPEPAVALDPNRGAQRPDSNPRPEDAEVVADAEGIYGGRYVGSLRQDPKTWNVLTANETSSTDITSGMLYEGLATMNNMTQDIEPSLAKSWESSPDGLEWTFHLRRGCKWSDGHPLTADDVMFTAEILYDDVIHPSASDLCKVEGVPFVFEKIDDTTVKVTLPKPYGPFLNVIGSVYIMPKHKLEKAYRSGNFESTYGVNTKPSEIVTSGPWMVAQFEPQQKVVLKPNPYYYKFDSVGNRLPYLDEVVYLIVPDQNAEILKFQSGQSDEVYFRAEDYALLKGGEEQGNYLIHDLGMEMGTQFLWFNLNTRKNMKTGEPYVSPAKQKIFGDVNFRKAVAHAVDRQAISQTVFYGMAEPLYGPIPPVNKKWYCDDVTRYEYDLDKAKSILKKAGYEDRDGDGILENPDGTPCRFNLVTNADNRERISTGNIIADDLKKIGISCTLTPSDFNSVIVKLRESYDYDAILLGLTGGVPPDPIMSANVFKSAGKTHFWNPEQIIPETPWEARVDSLMNAQISIMEPAERKKVFDEVQRILTENVPMIYTVARRGMIAIRDNFTGLEPTVLRPWVLWQSETISYDPQKAQLMTPAAAQE